MELSTNTIQRSLSGSPSRNVLDLDGEQSNTYFQNEFTVKERQKQELRDILLTQIQAKNDQKRLSRENRIKHEKAQEKKVLQQQQDIYNGYQAETGQNKFINTQTTTPRNVQPQLANPTVQRSLTPPPQLPSAVDTHLPGAIKLQSHISDLNQLQRRIQQEWTDFQRDRNQSALDFYTQLSFQPRPQIQNFPMQSQAQLARNTKYSQGQISQTAREPTQFQNAAQNILTTQRNYSQIQNQDTRDEIQHIDNIIDQQNHIKSDRSLLNTSAQITYEQQHSQTSPHGYEYAQVAPPQRSTDRIQIQPAGEDAQYGQRGHPGYDGTPGGRQVHPGYDGTPGGRQVHPGYDGTPDGRRGQFAHDETPVGRRGQPIHDDTPVGAFRQVPHDESMHSAETYQEQDQYQHQRKATFGNDAYDVGIYPGGVAAQDGHRMNGVYHQPGRRNEGPHETGQRNGPQQGLRGREANQNTLHNRNTFELSHQKSGYSRNRPQPEDDFVSNSYNTTQRRPGQRDNTPDKALPYNSNYDSNYYQDFHREIPEFETFAYDKNIPLKVDVDFVKMRQINHMKYINLAKRISSTKQAMKAAYEL